MRYFHVSLLVLLALAFSEGIAQQRVLDSLEEQIRRHPKPDSARINAILDYVIEALNNNTSNFLPYMEEVIAISKKTNDRRGLQKGYMIGQIYFSDRARYDESFQYADSAFAVLKNDTALNARQNTGHLYNNIAGDYYKLGNYDKAIESFGHSAKIFEEMDHPFLAVVYSSLAEVHEVNHDIPKSIAYDKSAIAIAQKSGNERTLAGRLMNYAIRLINRKEFMRADSVMDLVEPIVMRLESINYLQLFYYNRAYIDRDSRQYDVAVANYRKSLGYAEQSDDVYYKTNVLEALSDCLIDMNRMEEAKSYLEMLLRLASVHGLKAARRNAYLGLAKWHERRNDYKGANNYLQKVLHLNDSLFSEESREKIAGLEVRYNVEKKAQEISALRAETSLQSMRLRQKDTLNYILIGSAVALLVISLLSFRSYKQKQKLHQHRIAELEAEKQLNAAEAVLKGEEQERTRLAKDLHDGLGGMLSGIKYSFNTMKGNLVMTPENHQAFERSMDMLDSSIKEMRRVAHNMMPEALVRFGLNAALQDYCNDLNRTGALRIDYQSIGLSNVDLDQSTSITIYRIVQELITNAIRHASATTVLVQLTRTNGLLSLTVEDDGKGFDTTILRGSKGIGWTNIQHRVEFMKGSLDVKSDAGKGTSVHIEFNA